MANAWLKAQRKGDLVALAEEVKLKDFDGLKKVELESALDEYLAEHSSQYSSDPKFMPYFASRARTTGSPVKRESLKDEVEKTLKVTKRRATKAAEELLPAEDDSSSSTALVRTPGRALSLASRIPLPASPADVAHAVDRSAVAIRARVTSLYHDSGITEATENTRASLSSVTSIMYVVAAFELWYLRPELLANNYAFTVPAVSLLGTPDYPVYVPDVFLLLSSSFWSPALTWLLTSLLAPSLAGYFFNRTVGARHSGGRGAAARRGVEPDYTVDPLTFSVAKALLTYVVYAQKVTLGGWLDLVAVERIDGALYGGWQGVLTGCVITALASVYDAVLKK